MESRRDNKKAQKLANELELKGLTDYFTKNPLPKSDDKDRKKVRDQIQKIFDQDNKKNQAEVKAIAGNNNMVMILNNTQFVILLSELRQTAADVNKIFSAAGEAPTWLADEFRIDPITESTRYENADKGFRKTYDAASNHFEEGKLAGNFLSISVSEYFSNSLDRLIKQDLPDNQRVDLACDMGQQIAGVFSDLEKHDYIWSDLKTSNIMLRDDNSIGISDKKAFMSYDDVLVKKFDSPYSKLGKQKNTDFSKIESTLIDNQFAFKSPETTTSPFEFRVRDINGKIIEGSLSNEELRSKFESDETYNTFRTNLDAKPVIKDEYMKKIYQASKEKYGTLTTGYAASYDNYTTIAFNSTEFLKEKMHNSSDEARGKYIEILKKEYSYQLAATLYITLTGKEEKFFIKPLDFSQPVFESPEGKQLQSLIVKLSHADPAQRISYQDAVKELNMIRLPIERKVEVQPELKRRPSLKSFGKRISREILTKKIVHTESPPEIPEKTVTPQADERAKRQQMEVKFKNMENAAGIRTGKPLREIEKEGFSKKSTISPPRK